MERDAAKISSAVGVEGVVRVTCKVSDSISRCGVDLRDV